MLEFITLTRAEPHLKDQQIVVRVASIDTFSANILAGEQTLMRVNGKEFIVAEAVAEIQNKIEGV